MDRNLIFAVVLTTIVIVLFSSPFYQNRFGKNIPEKKANTPASVAKERSQDVKTDSSASSSTVVPSTPSATAPSSLAAAAADTSKALAIQQVLPPAEQTITLENEKVKVILSTRGGIIATASMKQFKGAAEGERAQLVKKDGGWFDGFVGEGAMEIPLHSIVFNADSTTSTHATLTAELTDKRFLHREYTLDSDGYVLSTNTVFDGPWTEPSITYSFHGGINRTEPQIRQLRIWPFSMLSPDQSNMFDKIVYLGQGERVTEENGKSKTRRVYAKESAQTLQSRKGNEGFDTFTGDLDWYAVKNKYFLAAAIPLDNRRWSVKGFYERDNNGNNFDYSITKKNTDGSVGLTFYMGPTSFETLKAQGHNLTQVMDLSWKFLRPLAVLFLWIVRNLHTFISNWGLVLIIFSILIKVVLYPLSKSSTDSMKKMAKLQPQIAVLKEKLKNDPQRLHKATMELYKAEGVNPFGGCLPLLLQMPVFFALYPVVGQAFELRQAMFIPRWIEDLSRPDPFYILPIAMGVSFYLQSRTTMTDPSQKAMIYIMPVMMVILFANFSAGLTLYWLMFNLLSWAQQELIKTK